MPKIAKELTALEVKRLTYDGTGNPIFKAVGGVAGLYLQLTSGQGRSWALKYNLPNRRRAIGLGPYPEVSLADARAKAREYKEMLKEGLDPWQHRKDQQAKLAARMTFAQAIDGWDRDHPNQFSSDKHRTIWLTSVRSLTGLLPVEVEAMTEQEIWAELEPIAKRTPDTARRTRGRIEAVLDWAEDEKQRSGPNPAASGWLKRKMSARTSSKKVSRRPALAVEDAPRWWAEMQQREGMGTQALLFLALTAGRSSEVRGATWDEIDFDTARWIIPAERMKMDREHVVPLSVEAVSLLQDLPRLSPLVFTAARGGQLSDMTLSAAMKRQTGFLDPESKRPAVPHGLRSTFRMWAGREGFNRELAELALAHKYGNSVEQAYQRDLYIEQRRPMMQAWSEYLHG